jgi:hypothetical protein
LLPSPSTVHPEYVIDSHVFTDAIASDPDPGVGDDRKAWYKGTRLETVIPVEPS